MQRRAKIKAGDIRQCVGKIFFMAGHAVEIRLHAARQNPRVEQFLHCSHFTMERGPDQPDPAGASLESVKVFIEDAVDVGACLD